MRRYKEYYYIILYYKIEELEIIIMIMKKISKLLLNYAPTQKFVS